MPVHGQGSTASAVGLGRTGIPPDDVRYSRRAETKSLRSAHGTGNVDAFDVPGQVFRVDPAHAAGAKDAESQGVRRAP